MARCATTCIAVFWLAISIAPAMAAENCTVCHRVVRTGLHRGLACSACHGNESAAATGPAADVRKAAPCDRCHRGTAAIFGHVMGTRSREKDFVARSLAAVDKEFFGKNCGSCHVRGCQDCHEGGGHRTARASPSRCLACHKGYFVGADYFGKAPREDNLRYQRGKVANGETFLTMLPDVHAEAGIPCGTCHTMRSLVEGKKAGKTCTDCHRWKRSSPEHRVAAHRDRLECYACHSAWAAQEYGTFFLRFTESRSREDFRLKGSETESEYLRSAYLRRQDAPPLGMNGRGKISPIRPQFIAYYTHLRRDKAEGKENRLLAAEWKAFFPHTIRRGTILCDGCHDAPRRFLMEDPRDRIYRLREDGMMLESFWNRTGQRVVNGAFLPAESYRRLSARGPDFQRGYLEKWRILVHPVDDSSAR